MNTTPFELDIADQPDALRRFAQLDPPAELARLVEAGYDRIVLTGMGSSHFAALPTWRRLVETGRPAWWVDAGQLLESPELITSKTLLIATSQSGASGEVVALLDNIVRPAALIAVTNDPASPLAHTADVTIELASGAEATVSTKSYLNTLAAHDLLTAGLTGAPASELADTIAAVEASAGSDLAAEIAAGLVAADDPRLVYVGFGDHAATALYAGLITKEGAKVPAEGFIGGAFRHGPLELAGPGLVAVLFGGSSPLGQDSLLRLGKDLVQTGSTVIVAAGLDIGGTATTIPAPRTGLLAELAHGAVLSQYLTAAIARARGITPGAFAYGSKITTAL